MRAPKNSRERLLSDRIDRKAQEILCRQQKWHDGILHFSNPYDNLTTDEWAFITRRLAEWQMEIVRRNGRETIH